MPTKVAWLPYVVYLNDLAVYMKTETKVTSKGASTIPEDLRKRDGMPNAMQRHIRARAGAWMGKISGVQLLKRTRP